MHTHLRPVAGRTANFMFAEPIISAVMHENPAAVRVDVNTLVVKPKRARNEFLGGVRLDRLYLQVIRYRGPRAGQCYEKTKAGAP